MCACAALLVQALRLALTRPAPTPPPRSMSLEVADYLLRREGTIWGVPSEDGLERHFALYGPFTRRRGPAAENPGAALHASQRLPKDLPWPRAKDLTLRDRPKWVVDVVKSTEAATSSRE